MIWIQSHLDEAISDSQVAQIEIRSSSPRAFCAGGDIKAVVHHLPEAWKGAMDFFYHEYRLDYAVAHSPKPVHAYADGYVFGGGWGVYSGAQIRNAAPKTTFCMPETLIGFFPDVGCRHFLTRLGESPKFMLFLTLFAHRISAGDAEALGFCGDQKNTRLSPELQALKTYLEATLLHPTELLMQWGAQTTEEWAKELGLKSDSLPLIQSWKANLSAGSPLSQRIAIAAFTERLPQPGLTDHHAQVLEQDFILAANFCKHREFKEGVRALLVDKSKNPHWSHPTVKSVSQGEIQAFFDAPAELKLNYPQGLGLFSAKK